MFGNACGAQCTRLGNHRGSLRRKQQAATKHVWVGANFLATHKLVVYSGCVTQDFCDRCDQPPPCTHDIFAGRYINYSAHMDLLGTHLDVRCKMQKRLYYYDAPGGPIESTWCGAYKVFASGTSLDLRASVSFRAYV